MDETTPSAPEAAKDAAVTAKDKMRESLERKKAREHLANQSRPNDGSVHGSQVNGGGKRTFRRKSG
ncbi:hypothetical protein FHE66_12130 [Georgenia sp. 311]|uniref:DUF5302 domain-containing protein n=1 Tax=Georgenia sp. 311 TaxID=2585134 RepID=UPI0011120E1A|nr:DUF5302 domain-containing protein [Georgenia sp. 311]TNC17117.1 hypothetical protein FHE66_12130 [Georgenia sp. 311]